MLFRMLYNMSTWRHPSVSYHMTMKAGTMKAAEARNVQMFCSTLGHVDIISGSTVHILGYRRNGPHVNDGFTLET